MIVVVWILLALLAWWYLNYREYETMLRKFPGPTPLPIIGNALDFSATTKAMPSCLKYFQKFQGNFKLYIGFQPILMVAEQKSLEFILSSSKILTKSNTYRFVEKWLGEGMITANGDKWRRHRRIITPTFHFQILEKYSEVFDSATNILIDKLSGQVGKGVFDIFPYINSCALDIICESAMGCSMNAQDDPNSEYVRNVNEVTRIIVERTFSPIQQYDFLYIFSKNYWREKAALKVLHSYTDSIIRRKKLELISNPGQNSEKDYHGAKKKMAFLDLLMSLSAQGDALTDAELREEVDTFVFAGHDTTASSMGFALHCLSNHPEVQNKVFDEIKIILADDPKRQATCEDLQEMKYLNMVIKESLRLYPAVPLYGREIMKDVEVDGKILPKGLTIMVPPFAFHRDPQVFPDPEKFDPDRFLPENVQAKPFTYLPFSAGPRNCIGQKFALLEMKSTISRILQHFEVLPSVPAHQLELAAEGVLKSRSGIRVQLRRRNWDT